MAVSGFIEAAFGLGFLLVLGFATKLNGAASTFSKELEPVEKFAMLGAKVEMDAGCLCTRGISSWLEFPDAMAGLLADGVI